MGGRGVLVGDWQTGVEESAESVDGEEERAWHCIQYCYRVVVVIVGSCIGSGIVVVVVSDIGLKHRQTSTRLHVTRR